jgi:hypothetical protein
MRDIVVVKVKLEKKRWCVTVSDNLESGRDDADEYGDDYE